MRQRVGSGHWVAVSRIALVGLIGSAAAACSSDTVRFAETRSPTPSPPASGWRRAAPDRVAAPELSRPFRGPMPTPRSSRRPCRPCSPSPCRSRHPHRFPRPAPIQPRPGAGGSDRSGPSPSSASSTPRRCRPPRPPSQPPSRYKRVRPGLTSTAQAPAPAKSAPMQVASATNEPLVSAPKPLVSAPKPVVEQPKVAASPSQSRRSRPWRCSRAAPPPEAQSGRAGARADRQRVRRFPLAGPRPRHRRLRRQWRQRGHQHRRARRHAGQGHRGRHGDLCGQRGEGLRQPRPDPSRQRLRLGLRP